MLTINIKASRPQTAPLALILWGRYSWIAVTQPRIAV